MYFQFASHSFEDKAQEIFSKTKDFPNVSETTEQSQIKTF